MVISLIRRDIDKSTPEGNMLPINKTDQSAIPLFQSFICDSVDVPRQKGKNATACLSVDVPATEIDSKSQLKTNRFRFHHQRDLHPHPLT